MYSREALAKHYCITILIAIDIDVIGCLEPSARLIDSNAPTIWKHLIGID